MAKGSQIADRETVDNEVSETRDELAPMATNDTVFGTITEDGPNYRNVSAAKPSPSKRDTASDTA